MIIVQIIAAIFFIFLFSIAAYLAVTNLYPDKDNSYNEMIGRSCICITNVNTSYGYARLNKNHSLFDFNVLKVKTYSGNIESGKNALIVGYDEQTGVFFLEKTSA